LVLARSSSPLRALQLNEPFAGDIYNNPLLLVPGVADSENLEPFHNSVAAHISAADPDLAVFVESVTWDDFIPVGFNSMPLQPPDRTGISFHYYNLPNFDVDWQVESRLNDAQRLGAGAFLTEFNFNADATNTTIPVVISSMEAHSVSWLGWEYKPFVEITGWGWGPVNPDGTRNDGLVSVLSRPYPQLVCGYILGWSYNENTTAFSLMYEPQLPQNTTDGCDGGASVYLNCDFHYPGCNANVTITEGSDGVTATVVPAPAPESTRATKWATLDIRPIPGQGLPRVVSVNMIAA
jgi:endoglycosylceramidase